MLKSADDAFTCLGRQKCFAAGDEQPWQQRRRSAAFCLAAGRALMQGENFPARPCLAPAKSACCRRALISQNCACSGKICLLQALFCKAVSVPRQSMPVAGECFFAELCMVQKNLPAVGGCFSQSCACPRKSLSVAGAFLQGRVCSPAKHACCKRVFFRKAALLLACQYL